MRRLILLAMLLALAGCATWNWHDVGQAMLQSLCDSFEDCSVPCSDGDNACR